MDKSRFSLSGKVALITGGSRGIGKACALAFAEAGADVVVSSRKQADLDGVAAEIKAKNRKALAIAAHVAKSDDQKRLVDQVVKEFGRIDILFNNAGTNPYPGTLLDAEEWAWDTTMNVNLKGPFMLSQLVARIMKEKGGGNIINTASVAGFRASSLSIYCVTKAGLIMLTQCMAREWGQFGIRVNAIAPGVIETRLSEALWKDPAVGAAAAKRTPVGFLGQPDDVAGAVLYLASDASRFITGETIIIDGGAMVGTATSLE
ncbi:MAG: short-chain dehydrogenase [Deltaproteobacteria bacterium RBG_13_43_22]|nr:MAG: short-chain dehydrogenase [Deltaproteobacteria bacterium RBG_13_43_22]